MKRKILVTDVVKDLKVEKKILKNYHLTLKNIFKFNNLQLEQFDGVITGHEIIFDYQLLKSLKNCKVIVRYGAGYNNVDIKSASNLGIKVFNVPDYGSKEVADHAVAMTMNFLKNLNEYYFKIIYKDKKKYWDYLNGGIHRRLSTLKIGIVGLGRIGTDYANKMYNLETKVFFYDPYVVLKNKKFIKIDSLKKLFEICDVISLHAPLTEETKFFISDKLFNKRKEGLVLINVARGELIKEQTIIKNLKNNKIMYYGADVLENEPIKFKSDFFKLINNSKYQTRVIITPHAAFYTEESFYDLRFKASESIINFFQKKSLKNCVNL